MVLLLRAGVIGFGGGDRDLILEFQEILLADAADVHQVLDLIFEDDRLNVYAGELEVRPPGAPTIRPVTATLPVVLDALTPICATLG